MNGLGGIALQGPIVEEDVELTLAELCRACRASEVEIREWVVEGVLEPTGSGSGEWRFSGSALRRSRLASRLTRDLAVNPPGVALALDLLDELAALRAALQRGGMSAGCLLGLGLHHDRQQVDRRCRRVRSAVARPKRGASWPLSASPFCLPSRAARHRLRARRRR